MKPDIVVRLAAIALGIMSATLLAHAAFGLRFSGDFLMGLDVVRDVVGAVVLPFELAIVSPAVRWLHEQGFAFELRSHWHSIFIVLWLVNASHSRVVAPASDIHVEMKAASYLIVTWAWAAMAAMMGGVIAGTAALSHPAVFWGPLAAFFFYQGVRGRIDAAFWAQRTSLGTDALAVAIAAAFAAVALGKITISAVAGTSPATLWWAVSAFFLLGAVDNFTRFGRSISIAPRLPTNLRRPVVAVARKHGAAGLLQLAVAAIALALALGALDAPAWVAFRDAPSPSLAALASFLAIIAVWYLLWAFLWSEGKSARASLDILAVLGGATAIVIVARLWG